MTATGEEPLEDVGPAEEVEVAPLPRRRPAELGTFVSSLGAVAAAVGFNLSTEAVIAGFVIVGSLPAIVTWTVDLYRDTIRDLGD